jgi:hypothetical protein
MNYFLFQFIDSMASSLDSPGLIRAEILDDTQIPSTSAFEQFPSERVS